MKPGYCIVIPNYNHTQHIEHVLQSIAPLSIPVIMVNDGSDDVTTQLLDKLPSQFPFLEVIHLTENQGKGGAVMTGLLAASQRGYSHAIQVDADGQHNLSDIPEFIRLSQQSPDSVICGIPDYDESVPLGRLIPRYLTHFWVWVETLSFQIKDSMCGFRLYPLKATCQLIGNSRIGKRMDFDTEILVKLYWQNVPVINLPTKVTYPEDGSSHFQLFRDNWLITKMHTRLFFGMLPRAPRLISKKFKRASAEQRDTHWSATKERGSTLGIQLLVWLYRVLGQWFFRLILLPVIAYFVLTGNKARRASYDFLRRLNRYQNNQSPVRWYHVYKHFYQFGLAAVDKIRAWLGDIRRKDIIFHNVDAFEALRQSGKQKGAIFIGSHLGNLELCRAIGESDSKLTINALVFTKHALKFQAALDKFNPKASVNLIQVDTMGADTAIKLREKVDAGEIVIIVGDRTSVTQFGRVNYAPFLGEPAPFSQGPFILAGLLECPAYLLFCLKQSGQYHIYLEHFSDSLKLTRTHKKQQLQSIIERYAERLEYYCLKAPYQWFNFFDFWQKDDQEHIQRTIQQQEKHHSDDN
ncbi:glycosyltransferase family 2 protein [Kangiella sediminilitoris]|uniref:Acyltransferase n=1 Tax=Kangiella sediminilitoris TaxID=1144748 RepID=A0A1B3BDY4_9GAMM|nr:glycosyltransferase family 2 protein [Kangiella sediminilitoris]AOE50978.1 acyltransferase [Kangiella sediminilitoris]